MAEGNDELLTRLGVGRVGRRRSPQIKFLKRTLRWREEEASFSQNGETWFVEELWQLLGLSGTKTNTPGTKATESGWDRWTLSRQRLT